VYHTFDASLALVIYTIYSNIQEIVCIFFLHLRASSFFANKIPFFLHIYCTVFLFFPHPFSFLTVAVYCPPPLWNLFMRDWCVVYIVNTWPYLDIGNRYKPQYALYCLPQVRIQRYFTLPKEDKHTYCIYIRIKDYRMIYSLYFYHF
jgi:hypothetical protein